MLFELLLFRFFVSLCLSFLLPRLLGISVCRFLLFFISRSSFCLISNSLCMYAASCLSLLSTVSLVFSSLLSFVSSLSFVISCGPYFLSAYLSLSCLPLSVLPLFVLLSPCLSSVSPCLCLSLRLGVSLCLSCHLSVLTLSIPLSFFFLSSFLCLYLFLSLFVCISFF